MAKLYFYYGAMGAGKTTSLLQVAHNYSEKGMNVFLMKPASDTKGGHNIISRLGVSCAAAKLISMSGMLMTLWSSTASSKL